MQRRWAVVTERQTSRRGAGRFADSALFRPLCFEPLFEPYVIVSPALRASTRASRYGRNKAAHALQLHRCGATFWPPRARACSHAARASRLAAWWRRPRAGPRAPRACEGALGGTGGVLRAHVQCGAGGGGGGGGGVSWCDTRVPRGHPWRRQIVRFAAAPAAADDGRGH